MPHSFNIMEVSESERKAVFKRHNVSENEFEEMVKIIREWLKKTNLPQEDSPTEKIKMALFNQKCNIEKTKRSLEGYYRIRTIHSDFWDKMVPNTSDYNEAKKLSKAIVMPKLTPDLCRITIFRLNNPQDSSPQPTPSDGLIYELVPVMGIELRLLNGDYFYSNILIIDLTDFGIKHLIKYTPTVCNTMISVLLALNLRFKNIHFLNMSSVFDKVMTLVKFFLPSRFYAKVITHPNYESLYEYIPKEYLPSNYGGNQPSIEEIQEKWCEELEKNGPFFQKLLTVKCKDIMENKIQKHDEFGMDGSFRKLAVD